MQHNHVYKFLEFHYMINRSDFMIDHMWLLITGSQPATCMCSSDMFFCSQHILL
jgi:hypothetical protein